MAQFYLLLFYNIIWTQEEDAEYDEENEMNDEGGEEEVLKFNLMHYGSVLHIII